MMRTIVTAEDICRRLKPVFGKKMDQIYMKYALSADREEKQQIGNILNVMYEKHLNTTLLGDKILLEPPGKETIKGDYPLGKVIYADKELYDFGLRDQDWPRHMCVSGMSGSGKTTFAFQVLANFILHKKPFVIFDWKKSFRPLMLLDKEVMCFTVGNENVSNLFKVNINRPPKGVGPKEWVSILCDIINESFFTSYGVQKLLRETLDKAFRDFGVYQGSNNYPTWRQIKDRLEERAADGKGKRGRESEWLESALRVADSLTFGNFGEAVNCKDRYGFSVEELLNKKVIFEMHALSNSEKKFFCEFLLTYIYFMKKINQSGYSEQFKSAIVVDEAHNIFLKERTTFVKESITDMIYRELREYGISLVCLDQHVSKLSEVVAGNSACTVAFQQILPHDVETISGLMQIRDRREYFSMLPVGHAIVRLAERHYKPFLMSVPFIKIKKKTIDDSVVKKKMDTIVKFHKRKGLFKESCSTKNIKKIMTNLDGIYKHTGVETKGDGSDLSPSKEEFSKVFVKNSRSLKTNLGKQHKDFMQVLARKPLATTKVYQRLKLSSRKCDSVKQDLIGLGLIEVDEVRDERGRSKMLKLSDDGLQLLNGKRGQ